MFCHSNQYMLTLHMFNHLWKEKWLMSPNIGLPSQRLIFLCSWEHECAVLFGRCTSIRQKPNSYLPLQGLQKSSQTFDHQVIHISTQHVKESPFTKAPLKLYIDMDTKSWFILFLWMRWKSINKYTKQKTRWAKFM